jgi:hypothetical protein
LNHGGGIAGINTINARVLHNNVHDNGEDGISFGGEFDTNPLIEYNTISHNDFTGFGPNFGEGGGGKLSVTTGARVLDNKYLKNQFHGLWFDEGSKNAIVERNVFEGQKLAGLRVEVSDGVTVWHNRFINNSQNPDGSCNSTGEIEVAYSLNITVSNNTFTSKCAGPWMNDGASTKNGPTGVPIGQPTTAHVHFIHNKVTYTGTSAMLNPIGGLDECNETPQMGDDDNYFDYNTYSLPNLSQRNFMWNCRTLMTWAQWQKAGQDAHGSLK